MDQRVEPFALLATELHEVLLYGSLFRGHDASPSLRSHRFSDSRQNQGRWVLASASRLEWAEAELGRVITHRVDQSGALTERIGRSGSEKPRAIILPCSDHRLRVFSASGRWISGSAMSAMMDRS